MYLPESAQITDFLNRELQKSFSPKLVDVKKRVRLVADLEKYRLEDPYFVAQYKGMIPKHYSIYFDEEYICGFDSSYLPDAILLLFWRGMKKAYGEGKIYLDEQLYKRDEENEKKAKLEAEIKEAEKINKLNVSPEIKDIISSLNKRRKKKKKL